MTPTGKTYPIRTFQDVVNVGLTDGPECMERCIDNLAVLFRKQLEMVTAIRDVAVLCGVPFSPEDATCDGMDWTDDGGVEMTGMKINLKVTP